MESGRKTYCKMFPSANATQIILMVKEGCVVAVSEVASGTRLGLRISSNADAG